MKTTINKQTPSAQRLHFNQAANNITWQKYPNQTGEKGFGSNFIFFTGLLASSHNYVGFILFFYLGKLLCYRRDIHSVCIVIFILTFFSLSQAFPLTPTPPTPAPPPSTHNPSQRMHIKKDLFPKEGRHL